MNNISLISLFSIWKRDFLPLLVQAREATYAHENIATGWRGAGLIAFNARHDVAKGLHRPVSGPSLSAPTMNIATPKNSSVLLRQTRQAKIMLKGVPMDRNELLDVIERLEWFGIAAEHQGLE